MLRARDNCFMQATFLVNRQDKIYGGYGNALNYTFNGDFKVRLKLTTRETWKVKRERWNLKAVKCCLVESKHKHMLKIMFVPLSFGEGRGWGQGDGNLKNNSRICHVITDYGQRNINWRRCLLPSPSERGWGWGQGNGNLKTNSLICRVITDYRQQNIKWRRCCWGEVKATEISKITLAYVA